MSPNHMNRASLVSLALVFVVGLAAGIVLHPVGRESREHAPANSPHVATEGDTVPLAVSALDKSREAESVVVGLPDKPSSSFSAPASSMPMSSAQSPVRVSSSATGGMTSYQTSATASGGAAAKGVPPGVLRNMQPPVISSGSYVPSSASSAISGDTANPAGQASSSQMVVDIPSGTVVPASLATPSTALTARQTAASENLANDFVNTVQGASTPVDSSSNTASAGSSSQQQPSWQNAQWANDERYRLLFGDQMFVQQQLRAQQEANGASTGN